MNSKDVCFFQINLNKFFTFVKTKKMLFLTLKCVYEIYGNNTAEMKLIELQKLSKWKNDLFHLIYPNICLICENELSQHQNHFCSFCGEQLQYTYFERYDEPTLLDQLFWGRIPVHATYSYLYFEKGKSVQPLLHALKYKDKPEIGVELGRLIGKQIKEREDFKDVDALIPVPLHANKEFKRGYNQSEKLADGIASVLNTHVDTDFISRIENTDSQTKKNRFLRWDNVENKFKSSLRTKKMYKHIAIVDDVITTGSTMEAIIQQIQKNYPEIRISVISLAIAK